MRNLFKKENGITLIALIITIIVLLILAGVSISLVVGENGILNQAQNSVSSTKSEAAKEQVALAWESCEAEYVVYGNGQEKSTYFTIAKLNESLNEGEITEVSYGINAAGDSELAYKVDDVYYKVQVSSAGVVSIVGDPTTTAPTLTPSDDTTEEPEVVEYLVDKVNVGDYVDIGIVYDNKSSFSRSGNETISTLTGWRVLSKSGSGESGTVKLVSAGCPLTYYHVAGDNSSISNLKDLYKELSIVTSGTTGFIENGFGSNNLQTIFTTEYIDTTRGVHALECGEHFSNNSGTSVENPLNEIENAYKAITGQDIRMTSLDLESGVENGLATTTLENVAGSNWNESYTDLLVNGQIYCLGGASRGVNSLWSVNNEGTVSSFDTTVSGVRPVVTLQSGVMIHSNNTGDGKSSSTAYSITK